MTESAKEAARRLLGNKIALGYVPKALHEYTNADGQPIYWRARMEHPDGDAAPEGRKIVRPLYLNGTGFRLGEPEFPEGRKPLYNLDKLAASDGPVWIVEGEKPADALTRLGVVATTSGGAQSAGGADWSPLSGRECVLWPDNDDPGRAYMGEVAAALQALGCSFVSIDVDRLGLPPKGDAADWFADRPNATLSDLEALPRLTPQPTAQNATAADPEGAEVCLVRGDTITPKPVTWIWPGYLAAGKLHILAGRPGCGKTTLALALAATITQGGRWPDGTRCEVGNVVVWSGEDDPEDTLAPRLIVNGADMTRVYFVRDVRQAGRIETFDPAKHMDALALVASRIGNVRLVLVDPVVSAVRGDGNSNTEVRRALQPIVDLAASLDAAAFGVSHFTKGSDGRDVAERVTGSLAFGAAPRVVLAAAKIPPKDGAPGYRVVMRAKCNNGDDTGGYRYEIEQSELPGWPDQHASRVLWGAAETGSARELLREAEADNGADEGSPRHWLAQYLRFGEKAAAQVFSDANANGYSKDQMHRAKRALRVEVRKAAMTGGWYWRLPEDGGTAAERAEDGGSGPEDGEDGGLACAPPSPLPSRSKMAAAEDGAEGGDTETPPSSLPSANAPLADLSPDHGRAWQITRPTGESFRVNMPQPSTLADIRAHYAGSTVERLDGRSE